ncbi:hypothetical protein Enr13x_17530 [Stieleria neptunia]|uniref:Uncharacterized protein n=1 Tax=Stieleria neptunia TaxID=2527979 RepID=A0A518HM61_9BACT|nr:hypothetical protein Enr13x_17530 [Stieleria neptunia]
MICTTSFLGRRWESNGRRSGRTVVPENAVVKRWTVPEGCTPTSVPYGGGYFSALRIIFLANVELRSICIALAIAKT